MSVVREAATAEDAVHEAFVRLAKRPGPPDGDAVAYVYRSVRNAGIDQIRKRVRRSEQGVICESIFRAPCEDGPAMRAETQEMKKMLMNIIDNLSDPQREVILLRGLGGLSIKQVAQTLEQPLSTIASRYRRALLAIKQQMEASYARS